jgi:hypothetical protein
MSDTTYNFLCLLEGYKNRFYVVASSTIFICQLKQVIKKKGNRLLRVDTSDFTLCKVRLFLVISWKIVGDH